LTGLYCHQAGDQSLRNAVTVAQVLGQAGYFTAMAGKWHLGDEPTDWGFQRYFGHLSGATNYFTGDKTFRLNGERFTDFGKDFYTTDANTNYAMRFVNGAVAADKPFFLYLAYNAPHYPLQAPQQEVEKYRGRYRMGWDQLRRQRYDRQLRMGLIPSKWRLSPRPDHVPAWDSLTPQQRDWEDFRMATFAGMVDRLDQNIGRLVAHLKSLGVFDNTLLVFCSDNGACPFERTKGQEYMPWDPRSYWTYDTGWAHAGNTPFRWYKQNQHEGGISSPMIVHWPAGLKTEAGAITRQPAHLIDLMATALDVTDASYPRRLDGREITPLQGKSLLPILEGKERDGHDYLYFQFSNNRAIRQGQWKLVSARGGPWELYDIEADRTELNDLAQQRPEIAARLKQFWHEVAANVDHAPQKQRKPVGDQIQPWPVKPRTSR
jgi:arylsulfatase